MKTGKAVGWVALGLLLFFGGWLGLAAAGVFDPQPIGQLTATRPLSMRTFTADDSHSVQWLPDVLPTSDYSLRLTAAFVEGYPESEYGLAVGEPGDYVAVVVSPLGYTAVRRSNSTQMSDLFPFQPWPHISRDDVENEIWLDVRGSQVKVRVNRELLWQGEVETLGKKVGLTGQTQGETAVVDYRTLAIFSD